MTPLTEDAGPETPAAWQRIGSIQLFQVLGQLPAVVLQNCLGDKFGICARQFWQLGAYELTPSPEKWGIVHFKMEI